MLCSRSSSWELALGHSRLSACCICLWLCQLGLELWASSCSQCPSEEVGGGEEVCGLTDGVTGQPRLSWGQEPCSEGLTSLTTDPSCYSGGEEGSWNQVLLGCRLSLWPTFPTQQAGTAALPITLHPASASSLHGGRLVATSAQTCSRGIQPVAHMQPNTKS